MQASSTQLLLPESVEWQDLPLLCADGVAQMALDEALLLWLQDAPPTLISRAYQWASPTLSVGKNQSIQSIQAAYQALATVPNTAVVRRPTGGRAILHGADVSFAFITNVPAIRNLSLPDSYCIFATWVRQTLQALGVSLQGACTPDSKAYTRSALCFETQSVGDLTRPDGSKVAGAAQWRASHGILQHGAAFINPEGISAQSFDTTLQNIITADLGRPAKPLQPQLEYRLNTLWNTQQEAYKADSAAILAKCATTSGSHLAPDSPCKI